jgi:hypothetical protein
MSAREKQCRLVFRIFPPAGLCFMKHPFSCYPPDSDNQIVINQPSVQALYTMKVTVGLLELLRHIPNTLYSKLRRWHTILIEIPLWSSSILDIYWDRVCILLEYATNASLHILLNSTFIFTISFNTQTCDAVSKESLNNSIIRLTENRET